MNYLAHAYLSFNHPQILIGNMVADFVKGKARFDYPAGIQAGMTLHRAIDEFTDGHPATARAKEFFRAPYRLYSAPIVDIVFDHFLANDLERFDNESLLLFTQNVYGVLQQNLVSLPPRFAAVLPHMTEHNWLYHYKDRVGIGRSLAGLSRRASAMGDASAALEILDRNFGALQDCYNEIAPAVKDYAKMRLEALIG